MSIKERAVNFVEKKTRLPFEEAVVYFGGKYVTEMMRSYISVAEEQKRIDIEKACEWLEKHTLREFLPQATIDRFRKEMEE